MDISPVHDRLMNFNLAYRRMSNDVRDLRLSRGVFFASEGTNRSVNDRVCKERGLRKDSRRSEENKMSTVKIASTVLLQLQLEKRARRLL